MHKNEVDVATTGHKDKDLIMELAIAVVESREGDLDTEDGSFSVAGLNEMINLEMAINILKPKTKVIDWSAVNYDIVPVNYLGSNYPIYVAKFGESKDCTLVTGKKIAWTGGECPLPEGVMVTIWYRGESRDKGDAVGFRWDANIVLGDSSRNIIWFEVTGLADGYEWGK